ncbi:MAG: AbrB/MazE/SpoVT family DNA-binding domain-containing protein [Bryobacteraceae bacterium]
MTGKAPTTEERIGRVGQRRQVVIPRELAETLNLQEGDFVAFTKHPSGVLMKPKRMVDPDDVLTSEESALIAKARREVAAGNFVTLDQLKHDLGHQRSPRRRKTA